MLFITIALNVVLIVKIPKGFFPVQDTGAISGSVRGPQDSSFPAMDDSIRQIGDVIKKDPAVANVMAFTGGNGATNTGNLYSRSNHWPNGKSVPPRLSIASRPKLNRLPVALRLPAGRPGSAHRRPLSNALYQYTIQADTVDDLLSGGPSAGTDETLPGFQDVSSDQQNGGLDELLTYDRVTAARLGLTAQSLDSALICAFGQSEVSIIYTQLNQYYVVLEVAPQYWQSPEGSEGHLPSSHRTGSVTCRWNAPLAASVTGQHHSARA